MTQNASNRPLDCLDAESAPRIGTKKAMQACVTSQAYSQLIKIVQSDCILHWGRGTLLLFGMKKVGRARKFIAVLCH